MQGFLRISVWLLGVLLTQPLAARELTDLAGRQVVLPERVQRIILGEGRLLVALGILEGDALPGRVVGTMGEYARIDAAGYAQYLERFPALAKVPRLGQTSAESFSTEAAIALKPDLAIFGLHGYGPSPSDTQVLKQLEAAGIRVVFVDFRQDPLANTPRSMTVLGQALGREAAAAAFNAAWRSALQAVEQGLQGLTERPEVFIESRVGFADTCCETMVKGMMGRFVDAAGGRNLARTLVPGEVGTVSAEYLLTHPPAHYIATAIGQPGPPQGLRIQMGAGVSEASARASLQRALQRPLINALPSSRNGRAHAIWHRFYDSPFNVVAVQVIAKWLHPQRFAKLDPQQTLADFYQRFQPVPLLGTYWVSAQ